MSKTVLSPRRWIFAGACVLGVAAGFTACSDDPTLLNAIVAPGTLKTYSFLDTTVYADTGTSFRHFVPMNGLVNYVGLSGGYTAMAVIQFTPAYFPIRDTAQVYSATLRLKTVAWYGDSSGTLSFNVYQVKLAWSSTTLTWDTVHVSGFYDASVVRGSYSAGAGPDTQWISIALDTSMVRQWLASYTAAGDTKYGVILVPNAGSTILRGFNQYSDDTSLTPTLDVIAGSVTGPARDTASYTSTMDTFVGNIDNLVSDPGSMYVQSGVVYRTALHFNVSFIPKASLISRAELLLDQNTAASRLNRFSGTPSIAAHLMTSSTDTTAFDLLHPTVGTIKSGTTFDTDVRYLVQTWIKGTNYGVLVTTTSKNDYLSALDSEHSSFDLYVFAGHRASVATSRPRIHVVYAVGN